MRERTICKYTGGSVPGGPSTFPIKESPLHCEGSIIVPTPIRPPGTANCSLFCSASNEMILDRSGRTHLIGLPSLDSSLTAIPGRTSISCPSWSHQVSLFEGPPRPKRQTFRTPCKILPPATPPLSSVKSVPGLLTSKERMTMSLASVSKERRGTGMCLTMYSLTASMLYLSCAEIGTIGALPAAVPVGV